RRRLLGCGRRSPPATSCACSPCSCPWPRSDPCPLPAASGGSRASTVRRAASCPERAALPQLELEEAGFLARLVVQPAARAFPHTLAAEGRIDRCHHIALLSQQRTDKLAILGVGADALLRAAVTVEGDDCRARR